MNLYRLLAARAADRQPLRAGLIGAGKFDGARRGLAVQEAARWAARFMREVPGDSVN